MRKMIEEKKIWHISILGLTASLQGLYRIHGTVQRSPSQSHTVTACDWSLTAYPSSRCGQFAIRITSWLSFNKSCHLLLSFSLLHLLSASLVQLPSPFLLSIFVRFSAFLQNVFPLLHRVDAKKSSLSQIFYHSQHSACNFLNSI